MVIDNENLPSPRWVDRSNSFQEFCKAFISTSAAPELDKRFPTVAYKGNQRRHSDY